MTRRPTDDDSRTGIHDGRAKRSTTRGIGDVELATPTEVQRDGSQPIVAISMKPAGAAAPEQPETTPVLPKAKLRPLSEISQTSRANLGRLAPPRDAKEVRARKLRDALIWGSAVIVVGAVVMLAVWFLARR